MTRNRHPLPDAPLSLEETENLFQDFLRFPHLALAVSGGADSLALLWLAAQWQKAGKIPQNGPRPAMTVLTVDHGLRPESPKEAQWVCEMAQSLGLPCVRLVWQGEKPARGIQAAAREARYGLMTAHCRRHKIPALVTAHHADDQAETFLMRLARGSGVDGLSAMDRESGRDGVTLLRPFLTIPHRRLLATVAAAQLSWLDDPSNEVLTYERVRLRKAMPLLASLGLTAETLGRSAQRLRRARAALEYYTDDFLRGAITIHPTGHVSLVTKTWQSGVPDEIAIRALGRIVTAVGGRDMPPRLDRLENLWAKFRAAPENSHTLGGCRITPLKDHVLVYRELGRMGDVVCHLKPGETAVWDGRFRVHLSPTATAPVTVSPLGPTDARGLRDALPVLAQNPDLRRVAPTLPAFRREGRLLAVPPLGHEGGKGKSHVCHATFLAKDLPPRDDAT